LKSLSSPDRANRRCETILKQPNMGMSEQEDDASSTESDDMSNTH
jgi:hypothetical protein